MLTRFLRTLGTPSGMLYVLLVPVQTCMGIYGGIGADVPAHIKLLYWTAFLWALGWWFTVDSRGRGVRWMHDMGLFLYVAWPVVMPIYLLRTRGARGSAAMGIFAAAYACSTLSGLFLAGLILP